MGEGDDEMQVKGLAYSQSSVEQARQGGHVSEMQRRRLLLAICELLADGGIESASVGRICKRAGVSRRTFYEVFDDREECLLAAVDEAIERIASEAVPAFRSQSRWASGVRGALTALLEHLDSHPGVARMCVVETLRAGPAVLARRRRALAALVAAVDEGRAASRGANDALPLTAEGVVGGALAVVHARLLEYDHAPLVELVNPLTGMIVNPYLGATIARRELERPVPKCAEPALAAGDPFRGLSIRFTYRTARVLATIAEEPDASNRAVADGSGTVDEGQMSRLLRRLETAGLIENRGEGHGRGEPNAWRLTERGQAIHATLTGPAKIPA
jgi:AcrR family transcriptional regulator